MRSGKSPLPHVRDNRARGVHGHCWLESAPERRSRHDWSAPSEWWRLPISGRRLSSRYELPPLHSILIAAWGEARKVSGLDGRRTQ